MKSKVILLGPWWSLVESGDPGEALGGLGGPQNDQKLPKIQNDLNHFDQKSKVIVYGPWWGIDESEGPGGPCRTLGDVGGGAGGSLAGPKMTQNQPVSQSVSQSVGQSISPCKPLERKCF